MNAESIDEIRLTCYALGELAGDEQAQIERLLERDDKARQTVEQLRRDAGRLTGILETQPTAALNEQQRQAIEEQAMQSEQNENSTTVGRLGPLAALAAVVLIGVGIGVWYGIGGPGDAGPTYVKDTSGLTSPVTAAELAAVEIELPTPLFVGTPPVTKGMDIKVDIGHPESKRDVLMAPADVKVISRGCTVTSSDDMPMIGELHYATDGNKEANEGAYVELAPGRQWLQVDLGKEYEVWGIVVWHYHATSRVYRDVIVQLGDDADMVKNVRTIFNNDYDNSSELGVGDDYEYFDEHVGKLLRPAGQTARYIRCWSNGNTDNDQNHYIEVEVWGRPVKGR